MEKPRSIFEDCMGNVHILCDENVYQFYITKNELVIYQPVSRKMFDVLVEPCVADFNNGVVMKQLKNHRQEYLVTLYNKKTMKATDIFQQMDEGNG